MSDDIDALLDDALVQMEEQDTQMAKEKEQRDVSAQKILEQVASEGDSNADMVNALQQLMGILSKGPQYLENADDSELAKIQNMLSNTLESVSQGAVEDEDKKAISECQELLNKVKSEETSGEECSPENLEKMKKELNDLLPQMQEAAEMASKQQKELLKLGEEAITADKAVLGAAPSGGPEVSRENLERIRDTQMLSVFGDLMRPEVMRDPFLAMRAAYGPWLETHQDDLTESERTRYQNQQRCVLDICKLIEERQICEVLSAAAKRDAERLKNEEEVKKGAVAQLIPEPSEEDIKLQQELLDMFSSLIVELQSYGEPPKDLFPSKGVDEPAKVNN